MGIWIVNVKSGRGSCTDSISGRPPRNSLLSDLKLEVGLNMVFVELVVWHVCTAKIEEWKISLMMLRKMAMI